MMVLPPRQMALADQRTIAAGTAGAVLMERAGAAVAHTALARFNPRAVLVLAGPGNNGGDGYVAARLLKQSGVEVRVAGLGPAQMGWDGPVEPLDVYVNVNTGLIVDALYGSGLNRPLEAWVARLFERIQSPILAVDVPSGLDGNSGVDMGGAPRADLTVTFAAKKPGHLLLPGRSLCGEVLLADIGVDPRLGVGEGDPLLFELTPSLFGSMLPRPEAGLHKYTRGHLLVAAGPAHRTGAARMAARAGLRAGAGLVTLLGSAEAAMVCAAHETSVMVDIASGGEVAARLADKRATALVIGPGYGVSAGLREAVVAALGVGKPLVLDADALTAFEPDPKRLFALLGGPHVLTPHEGEFKRLFKGLGDGLPKWQRALEAAKLANAVVVLKGADTCIAAPDGQVAINANAPPWLATAGSGDVLAGIIGGLLAQGMPPFEAACAGVYAHGETGHAAGPGLIAEDLPSFLAKSALFR
jgi:ADP-dependent NAD(P)H-hydrate dehydratase / NAD(P)H-hydrate epimerase